LQKTLITAHPLRGDDGCRYRKFSHRCRCYPLEGAVEEIAAPEVLRAAVERHLPLVVSPQMVSTLEPAVRDKILSRCYRNPSSARMLREFAVAHGLIP
jgi:hypothetical protein